MTTHNKPPVQFTSKQLEEMDKLFPRLVLTSTTPEPRLREYMGQQMVMQAIRDRVQRDRF